MNHQTIGFVFVEANVKKWGLAPMHGTLAPPPAYGLEAGSLLLERGTTAATSSTRATYRHPSSYDSDEDDDDDDEQPLIQIDIPRNGNATRYPQYPPPEYSTFPRSPAMIPPALAAAARYDSGTDTEDNVSASSTSSSSNDSFLGNNNNHSRRHHHS